jgi:hypothetical protein
MALGRWATVIGLSMTPALFAGQSAACAAGIAFGLDPRVMVPVVAVAGFAEGLIVAWLGGQTRRIGFVERFMERMRKPRAMEMAAKWGVWGGMILGVAAVGQEPILVALRALGIGMKKLVLPLAVSNALFAVVYYAIVRFGVDKFLETIKL